MNTETVYPGCREAGVVMTSTGTVQLQHGGALTARDASGLHWRGEIMVQDAMRRSPMLSLKEIVERYGKLAGRFRVPVPLAGFELGAEETGRVFSSLNEDYHISRFFHFSNVAGKCFVVSGEVATHIAIDEEIKTLL